MLIGWAGPLINFWVYFSVFVRTGYPRVPKRLRCATRAIDGGQMAGFATVPDAVRAAGVTMGDAVSVLRGADCGTPVGELTGALPGSVSAGAATSYASAWKSSFVGWCDQAAAHARNMVQAAANYGQTEHGNAESFGVRGGTIRGLR
jgi:hypothetical protein